MASIAPILAPAASPLSVFELPLREAVTVANRRTLPRVANGFEVALHEDGTVLRGVDLSFGGLMCVGPDPIWPGNVLDLDLLLPGEARPLAARGRVVELVAHRGDVAMRVRFEGIEQAARKRIAAWMARTHGA